MPAKRKRESPDTVDASPAPPWQSTTRSWSQYLREPTVTERMVDSSILHELMPYVEPHAPVQEDRSSPDLFKVPHFTEAETVLIRTLARIQRHYAEQEDPWDWLREDFTPAQHFCPLYRPDQWSRMEPVHSVVQSDLPFERLLQGAREHRIAARTLEAVRLYSQAIRCRFPNIPPVVMLEAQDATAALGMWRSRVLHWHIQRNEDTHQVPSDTPSPLDRLLQVATMLLIEDMPDIDLVGTFKEEVAGFFGSQHTGVTQQLDVFMTMTIACYPLVVLDNVRPLEQLDRPSLGMRDYCTDLLFFIAGKVTVLETECLDCPVIHFVQYLIAVACRTIQPYMKLPPQMTGHSARPCDFGFDAVRGLGLDEQAMMDEARSHSARWAFIAPLSSRLSEAHDTQLDVGLANDLTKCFNELIIEDRFDEIDQLCKALLLVYFRMDPTVSYGINRFFRQHSAATMWEGAPYDGILYHHRGLYVLETFYHANRKMGVGVTRSGVTHDGLLSPKQFVPNNSQKTIKDRDIRLRKALGVDCRLPRTDDLAAMLIHHERINFRNEVDGRRLNMLTPFFAPQFADFSTQQLFALENFFWRKWHRNGLECSRASPRHVIGLGRPTLSRDPRHRQAELEAVIHNLSELCDDIDSWTREHRQRATRNDEIWKSYARDDREALDILFGDIFALALRGHSDDPVLRRTRAWAFLYIAESYVDLAEIASDRDTNLLLACDFFGRSQDETEGMGASDVEVAAAQSLLSIKADFWRRGVGGVTPETVLQLCLLTERSRRLQQLLPPDDLVRNRSDWWATLVEGLFPPDGPFMSSRSEAEEQVHCIAREVCLDTERNMEALWWMQKSKADVTSGIITQNKTAAKLLGWIAGERTRDLDRESVISEALEDYAKQSRPFYRPADFRLFLIGARLALPTIDRAKDLEFQQFRRLFDPESEGPLSVHMKRLASPGRMVWVDWQTNKRKDVYHVCVLPIPGAPVHFDIDPWKLRPSQVTEWLRRFWTDSRLMLSEDEDSSRLRDLDDLVAPLAPHLAEGDILVLCTTEGLHHLPLHALYLRPDAPLITCHPVVYAASSAIFEYCLSSSLSPEPREAEDKRPSVSAVYDSLDPSKRNSPALAKFQSTMRASLSATAEKLGASFHWDTEVTEEAMMEHFEHRPLCVFVGHCEQSKQEKLWYQYLVLGDNDRLYSTDFLEIEMPASVLVLIGCGTAEQAVVGRDEPMGLIVRALSAGASSIIGTQWSVQAAPAVYYTQVLGDNFLDDECSSSEGLINLARVHQRAVLKLRARYRAPFDWAAYVLHGSPIMRDIWTRTSNTTV